ncbi:MAG: UDP-N-acetylglucosamine 1-carboxyvinyltransferase, partial [Patescibacteria group bacterium]
ILYRTPLTLTNVPAILDVEALCGILETLGATTSRGDHTLVLDASGMTGSSIPASMMSTLRASIVMAGPLLARFGEVIFSHPGGDIIGERPID